MTKPSNVKSLDVALSWPGTPDGNAVIEMACDMFSDQGLTITAHNPASWNTFRQKVALYVIHWPDVLFGVNPSKSRLWFMIARVLINLSILKLRGTRILWIVHNLEPHDLPLQRRNIWNAYIGCFSRLIDGWITLSPSTTETVLQRYPTLARKHHTYLWHPPYANTYNGTRSQARTELGLPEDATVIGHAGLLRPYKNLEKFAACFAEISPIGSLLLLTGRGKDGTEQFLGSLVGQVPGLHYQEGKLTPTEFDRALTSFDVFVAPYIHFLHSGAIVHALSRGCIIVAPTAPYTKDLLRVIGPNWIFLHEELLPTKKHLDDAVQTAKRHAGAKPNLAFMKPEANAQRLQKLLNDIGLTYL